MVSTIRFPANIVACNGSVPNMLWHGSSKKFGVGDIIRPRSDFVERWERSIPAIRAIEEFRPAHKPSMNDSVFCCEDLMTLGQIGFDFRKYLYFVQPINVKTHEVIPMSDLGRHDILWHDPEMSATSEEFPEVRAQKIAKEYWNGCPRSKTGDPLWEVLAPAVIVRGILKIDKDRFRYAWKHCPKHIFR